MNKSIYKKFSDEVVQNKDVLLSISTCNLHVGKNAFKTFLDALDLDFDEFSNDVSFSLKNGTVHRENFKSMEDITEENAQFTLKNVNSRWLSADPAVQRLFD